jgi:uncharacterized protein (TIGR02596 family)
MKTSFPIVPKVFAPSDVALSTFRARAFTLIEMLAVLGIIGVVAAIATPAVLGVINSTRITQAGDELSGLISQAQQIAVSESRPVEVRMYRMRDGRAVGDDAAARYRGIMIVKYYQAGEPDPRTATGIALSSPLAVADFGGIYRLPSGVEIADSTTLSSMMDLPEVAASGRGGRDSAEIVTKRGSEFTTMDLPEAVAYRSFLCLPESTDLSASDTWFVTLIQNSERERSASELKNFYTIQIEPVTGRLMSYRP